MNTKPSVIVADLYRVMASALIGKPDIEISHDDTEHEVILSAKARSEDHGKLIGSRGKNFLAVQLCLKAAASRMGKGLRFDQVRPPGSPSTLTPFRASKSWDKQKTEALVAAMACAMFSYPAPLSVRDVGSFTVAELTVEGMDMEQVGCTQEELRDAMRTIVVAAGKAAGREVTFDLKVV